jgi:hypothetical protein
MSVDLKTANKLEAFCLPYSVLFSFCVTFLEPDAVASLYLSIKYEAISSAP